MSFLVMKVVGTFLKLFGKGLNDMSCSCPFKIDFIIIATPIFDFTHASIASIVPNSNTRLGEMSSS
ncbi:Uncharacterised protein [Streptococcus pneumoniae]|nr:Uncharacterised protein [Streptococcus pneumoniae]